MSDTPETDAVRDDMSQNILEHARRMERERDEARERVKDLIHENENLYRRLESVHQVYRISGVCRELRADNYKLKAQQP